MRIWNFAWWIWATKANMSNMGKEGWCKQENNLGEGICKKYVLVIQTFAPAVTQFDSARRYNPSLVHWHGSDSTDNGTDSTGTLSDVRGDRLPKYGCFFEKSPNGLDPPPVLFWKLHCAFFLKVCKYVLTWINLQWHFWIGDDPPLFWTFFPKFTTKIYRFETNRICN